MIVNYIGFKDSLQNLNKRFSSTLFKLQFIILLPCSGLLKVEILSSCYSCTVPVLGSHTKVSVLYWSCPGVRLWLPVLYWSCPGVTSWVLVLCWSCPGVRQSLLVLSWSGPGDSCKQVEKDWLYIEPHELVFNLRSQLLSTVYSYELLMTSPLSSPVSVKAIAFYWEVEFTN